ncbi:MAG: N-carbamoylputrescine amidase [Kofleriaceae bacterium]|nr:N-carbamoylputrescine amidase [Myxococcales bacterium]MCB9560197.1 N-carbamoylputrescine amidase [Kofleriaceae bacterium]MCB9571240.1 N-carbamoylputrescine amidase [Kofleriaceae bacterium]
MTTVTVAALQTALTDDVDRNVARITELVREAAGRGARIILPSELFEGHYFCRTQREDDFARARPLTGHPTIAHFQKLAAELDVVIPVSFFEQDGPCYYNSIATIDASGHVLGVYRKSHIPDGPGYQEKFFFRPGDTGFHAYRTRHGTIGVAICWDQWFPEAARAMTLAGADLLLYPTAIGSEPEEPDFDSRDPWRRAMIGHAVTNVVGVIAANRVGTEGAAGDGPGPLTFYGSSFLCDERGDLLAELGRAEEGVAVATYDLERMRRARASMGFFRDRRPELYDALID